MPRGRPMAPLELSDEQRSELASISRSRSLPNGLVERAKIVLACAEGTPNCAVAARMGVSNATVGKWRARYRTYGLEDLHDELRSGRPRTYDEGVTHDYLRHGTTTLVAALDVVTGRVLSRCQPRHRHQELLSFLRHIDANVPAHLDVHLIVDNYATHKHAAVKAWLAKRPRYQVQYTPTYATWISQVERWLASSHSRRSAAALSTAWSIAGKCTAATLPDRCPEPTAITRCNSPRENTSPELTSYSTWRWR